ncbi:hypothetical protein QCA50_009112 [Cerrena zonata]|uniref:Uncharacterized protein n=1 Tax=Cerrena zonata TaxID=2478898 RepID=A0AAW0G2E0_9APHY
MPHTNNCSKLLLKIPELGVSDGCSLDEVLPPSFNTCSPLPATSSEKIRQWVFNPDEELLNNLSDSEIQCMFMRGTLHTDFDNSEPIAAICKFTFGGDCIQDAALLEREARFYTDNLRQLQGNGIPHFFGFFRGREEDYYDISALLLEDVGDPIQGEAFVCGRRTDMIRQVLGTMLEIHKAGLIPQSCYFNHHSVLERTIDGENQYTLVGFSNALHSNKHDPTEQCECIGMTIDDIGIADWKRRQVRCSEFRQHCEKMDIWIPSPIYYTVPDGRHTLARIDPYYARSEEMLTEYLKETYGDKIKNPEAEAKYLFKKIMTSNGDRIDKVGWPAKKSG